MRTHMVCVDGGGTKTYAVAYDSLGNEISSFETGFGNLTVDKEGALKNIDLAIKGCMMPLSNYKCTSICVGLAGVEVGSNKEIVKDLLEKTFDQSIIVVNDAYLAFNAALKGEDGILVISGTGSIAYGRYDNNDIRTGGWGHILGDEGSGYDIVIKAFKNMTINEDNRDKKSNLTNALLNRIGATSVSDAMNFIYKSNKGEIAALVPVIVNIANDGDEEAIEILNEAGKNLARLCVKCYKALGVKGKVNVAVKGSILTKISIVNKSFKDELKNNIGQFLIVDNNEPAVKGGYYINGFE